jgi:DedD protein
MDEGAKRRLAGTAFLVVLAVIFLPMLLEEETPNPVPEGEMTIPPRPDFDRGYDASVEDGPVEFPTSSLSASPEPTPSAASTPRELAPSALFEAPATAEPEYAPEFEILPEPEPEPESESKPVSALVEEGPTPTPEPAPTSESRPAPRAAPARTSASLSSWVIQVASLRERSRAYALVLDLRARGFPAYMQEVEVNQTLFYRVRIGPEVERKQIDSLAASLEAKTDLKGQIQRFP